MYRARYQFTLVELLLVISILIIVVVFIGRGCSKDQNEAIRALDANGFTYPIIKDQGVWGFLNGCDKNDHAWYDASVINPIGKRVDVIVCCGGSLSFIGCTVRTK
jgi:hypothetical protein